MRHAPPDTATTFRTAIELPWASDRPPWSGVHPSQIGETYGTLYATPGARGAWVLHHDLAQEHYAMTLLRGELPAVVELYSRRWHVRLAGRG